MSKFECNNTSTFDFINKFYELFAQPSYFIMRVTKLVYLHKVLYRIINYDMLTKLQTHVLPVCQVAILWLSSFITFGELEESNSVTRKMYLDIRGTKGK